MLLACSVGVCGVVFDGMGGIVGWKVGMVDCLVVGVVVGYNVGVGAVGVLYTLLMSEVVGGSVGCVVGSIATIHRPVLVHLFPFMMICPWYLMVMPILVNVISHPALQSFTTEMREWDANPGTIYPVCALCGRLGMFRRHFWVDLTLFPSGSVTLICCLVAVDYCCVCVRH